MKHIKTPLTPGTYFPNVVFSADDSWLATFKGTEPEKVAAEAIKALNAYDDMLAALKEARDLLDDRTDTAPEPCGDVTMLSVLVTVRAAIALAEPEAGK